MKNLWENRRDLFGRLNFLTLVFCEIGHEFRLDFFRSSCLSLMGQILRCFRSRRFLKRFFSKWFLGAIGCVMGQQMPIWTVKSRFVLHHFSFLKEFALFILFLTFDSWRCSKNWNVVCLIEYWRRGKLLFQHLSIVSRGTGFIWDGSFLFDAREPKCIINLIVVVRTFG